MLIFSENIILVLSVILMTLFLPIRLVHADDIFMLCKPKQGMTWTAKILSTNSNLKWARPHAPRDKILYFSSKTDERMKWERSCQPSGNRTACAKHHVSINRYTGEFFYNYPDKTSFFEFLTRKCTVAKEKKVF